MGAAREAHGVPRLPLTVLVLAAAALPGCAVEQAEGQDPTPSAPAAVRADTLAGVARRIYHQEAGGAVGHAAVKRIARDHSLLAALDRGSPTALRAAALRQLFNPGKHVVRLSLVRGGQTLTNVGGAFVVAPAKLPLHGAVLEASMQDVIGYVKLVRRLTGAQIVVRGAPGHVESSLAGAANLTLPASGSMTVAGSTYEVRSFREPGYGGESLTVWILSRLSSAHRSKRPRDDRTGGPWPRTWPAGDAGRPWTSVGAINAALLGSLTIPPRAAGGDDGGPLAGDAQRRRRRAAPGTDDAADPAAPARRDARGAGRPPGGTHEPRAPEGEPRALLDWPALHRNVADGTVAAVCVVATSLERGAPVAFVETPGRAPRSSDDLRYVAVQLRGEHVRASAAIPLLFPPVHVTHPRSAAGHYIDGGTASTRRSPPPSRSVRSASSSSGSSPWSPPSRWSHRPHRASRTSPPTCSTACSSTRWPTTFAGSWPSTRSSSKAPPPGRPPGRAPTASPAGHLPYRRIACALISPERRGMLGELAEQVFQRRYGGLRGLRAPDFPLMARLLGGGRARSRGELLSFLLFDEVFVEELLAAGRRDAERWVQRHPQLWCADPGHDAGFEIGDAPAAAEAAVLDEYRALRRR